MNSKKRRGVTNVGTASMMIILIGLSYAILAALAISSAHHDKVLSTKLANHTRGYYEASNEANERLSDTTDAYNNRESDGSYSFEVALDDTQVLSVELAFGDSKDDYTITKWRIESSRDWELNDTMPGLFGGNN